jgi:hypothetical protein
MVVGHAWSAGEQYHVTGTGYDSSGCITSKSGVLADATPGPLALAAQAWPGEC